MDSIPQTNPSTSPPPVNASEQDPHRALLRAMNIFQRLSDEELAALSEHVRRKSFRAGVPLFLAGDDGDKLFMIVSGSVEIQRATASGRILHLATRSAGELVGELSLIDGHARMADAVTASPCDTLILNRDSFLALLTSWPRVALAVMASLAYRLRESADDMEVRSELDVTGRLADCLLQMALSEGDPQQDGSIRLRQRRTHEQLAEMIGSARECVTRSLTDLRTIGAIRAAGRPTAITIADEHKLRKRCMRW